MRLTFSRFGLSRDCPQAHKCDAVAAEEDREGKTGRDRKSAACSLAGQCLAYRNATLEDRHLETAKRMLSRFRFVGLQEAYNSSVLLLAATFDLEVEENDFEKMRHTSDAELLMCKGYRRRAVGSDPSICRAVMKANSFDVKLYEVRISWPLSYLINCSFNPCLDCFPFRLITC